MRDPALVITIDGPAGSGKSTVARRVADALGIPYLDTGAMYRALSWAALDGGIAVDDELGLVALFEDSSLHMGEDGKVSWNGRDISREIRSSAVTQAVSTVAALPAVRERMVAAQRAFASDRGVVTEGRDQGSVVFPDAEFKFFLVADLDERARRRAEQLDQAGESVERRELADQIARRDRADSTRGVAPLVPPPGAVLLDSTGMTIDEVCAAVLGTVTP